MPNCDAPLIGPIAIIDVSNMTVTVSTSAIGPDALSPSGTLPPAPATPVIQINTNGGLKPEWIDPEGLVRLAGQDGWYTALIDIGPDKQPLTDERGKPQLSAITIDGALLCLAIDRPLSIAAGQTIQVLVARFGFDDGAPPAVEKIFTFGGEPITIIPAAATRMLLFLEMASSTFWLVENAKGPSAGPIVIAHLGPEDHKNQG